MPSTEPIQSGPYPVPADAPDGPTQMLAIVNWAASRTVMRFASTVARDAALPTPVDGMLCYVAADKSYYACVDGVWRVVLQDTGWTDLEPAAGWSQSGLKWRRWNGEIFLQGEVWGGTNGTACFVMPEGARPEARLSRVIARPASPTAYTTVGNLSIQTNGVATYVTLGGSIPETSPGVDVSSIRYVPASSA